VKEYDPAPASETRTTTTTAGVRQDDGASETGRSRMQHAKALDTKIIWFRNSDAVTLQLHKPWPRQKNRLRPMAYSCGKPGEDTHREQVHDS
jgi:hypothetical protein